MMANSAIANNSGKNQAVSRRRIFTNTPIAFLAVLVVLGTVQISQARIGFTREQCDTQYGKAVRENPISEGGYVVQYLKNDVLIWATFYPPRKVVDKITYNIEGTMTVDQQDVLLGLNAEGGVWSVTRDKPKVLGYCVYLKEWSSTTGGVAELSCDDGKKYRLTVTGSFKVKEEAKKKKASSDVEEQKALKQVDGL